MSEPTLPRVCLTHSPTIGAIGAALAKAQGVTESAPKNHTAEVTMKSGGKYSYSYADLAGVWDAARAPLSANGLAVVQAWTLTPTGLDMTTLLTHSSGEWVRGETVNFPVPDRTPQGVGTSITYCRRYTFGAMTGIVSEEDDDGGNGGKPKARPSRSDLREDRAAVAPSPGPTTLPNYGPAKGAPIRDAKPEHLQVYLEGARKSLADPEKAKWHAKESALAGALEAELARQLGAMPDKKVPVAQPRTDSRRAPMFDSDAAPAVPVYEQAMAFLKGAEAPGKVDEALRRAKAKVTPIEYTALETVARQRKEALARLQEPAPPPGDQPPFGPEREPGGEG